MAELKAQQERERLDDAERCVERRLMTMTSGTALTAGMIRHVRQVLATWRGM